ncbi:copper amine oxidase N-terminal domain-containing protein [Anaerotignum faecicola]|nr:copper amine oxidase N-terminal domain-containing protein [Anaerotignum faecicola]
MKKKLALLLSAVMVIGSLPMTAFAASTNTINRIVTGTTDSLYRITPDTSKGESQAPVLNFAEKDLDRLPSSTTRVTFKATLENTEWNIYGTDDKEVPTGKEVALPAGYGTDAVVTVLSDTQAIFTLPVVSNEVNLPLEVELTDEGDGKVTIDPLDSVLTAGTYRFANIVGGNTSTTVADTVNIVEGGTAIKTITITEAAAGSLEATRENSPLKIKLTSGFEFKKNTPVVAIYDEADFKASANLPSGTAAVDGASMVNYKYSDDGQELYLYFDFQNAKGTTKAATFSISGLEVKYDDDDVNIDDVCEITVSGANTDKQSVEIGKATTYGVSWEAENKTLPILYSGRADEDVDTLEVTLKEVIGDSWLVGRKTTITFPEGVKVMDVDVNKTENFSTKPDFNIEDNVITIENGVLELDGNSTNKHKKGKIEMSYTLSVAPDFTGDIVATLGGAGVEDDMEVKVATAVAPVTVEAETNAVSIDYRNVAVSDILIKEAYAGALEKDKTLQLELDKIAFDKEPKVEVVEGDLKIDDVEKDGNAIQIKIKNASSKTASTIKLSDVNLYLERDLPAGKYPLKLTAYQTFDKDGATDPNMDYGSGIDGTEANKRHTGDDAETTDAYFQTSITKGDKDKGTIYFDKRSVTVLDDYVEVVTAGRDQDDSTFTTKIVIQVGANTMTAGKETINLDVPAYIKDGYTMMPVRAVTEALSNVAIVKWDDPSHTVTITFGSRIVKMTVGSDVMQINGVDINMSTPCEITDSRAFIPLRDLGYALGLNDSKINWDDATKTATLN